VFVSAERTTETVAALSGMSGKQPGAPAKLADASVHLAQVSEPPVRFIAGTYAMQAVEAPTNALLDQSAAHRDLSSSLAHDQT